MITTVRATVSVLMLAGFYLLAVGVIGGVATVAVWLWQAHPGTAAGKVSLFAVAIAGALVVAMWKVLRAKPQPPTGLPLEPARAPWLWQNVHELAARVGTRPPDEIRLIGEVNAAVTEDAKLLGLVAGRRTMYIGLPLLQAFTVAQLRSVLAHELGHYSGNHTRLGALAHRGRMAIVATVGQLSAGNVAGWIFRGYAMLYILVEQAVSRRLEYEADRASVAVAGPAVAASALRELPVLDAAWGFFLSRYVQSGWDRGYAPNDVFGGFHHLLAARAGELGALRGEAPPAEASRWDSHPPIASRIAAIQAQPDPGVPHDPRPATMLVPDLARAAQWLQAETFNFADRTLLPWEELTATATAATIQRHADQLFRAAARIAGRTEGDLSLVLDLLVAGRGDELVRAAAPHVTPSDAAELLADFVDSAIAAAAVSCGAARWRHSWSGPAELIDPSGRPVPTMDLARDATDPARTARVRQWLANFGIKITAGRQASARGDATDAEVIGGLANMKCANAYVDLFILDRGLLLVPGPKSTDDGKRRLLGILQSAPLRQLAERNRFVAYEEIAAVRIVKPVPIRVEITLHSGEQLPLYHGWTGEQLAKGSDDLLRQALAPFVR